MICPSGCSASSLADVAQDDTETGKFCITMAKVRSNGDDNCQLTVCTDLYDQVVQPQSDQGIL